MWCCISVSLSSQCHRQIRIKSGGAGKSISDDIRTLILYGFVYDVDYSYLRQYNETLGKISGNLNQIAKRINSIGNVYEEDMKELKGIMDEVWRTQKAMLRKQSLINFKKNICIL